MGVSVRVTENHIGNLTQLPEGFYQRRDLAKTQQAWDVRKCERAIRGDLLEGFHPRIPVSNHGGDDAARPPLPGALLGLDESRIRPRHDPNFRQTVPALDPLAQRELYGARFGGRYIPRM